MIRDIVRYIKPSAVPACPAPPSDTGRRLAEAASAAPAQVRVDDLDVWVAGRDAVRGQLHDRDRVLDRRADHPGQVIVGDQVDAEKDGAAPRLDERGKCHPNLLEARDEAYRVTAGKIW